MIGKTISHYKILAKLGEGGMGVVYKAEDTKLDRLVALKFLPQSLAMSETDRARFVHEAKAAAAINHPNVCVIYAIEEHDDRQFIVMEYVEGVSLRKKVSSDQLSVESVIAYAMQIGEALQAAHEKGIVHRDIKSENIMVNARNQIKVMDFGLAKLKGALRLTKTASTVGTLAYMSPEQLQGLDADIRSDIFSFGVVLYEMLTSQLPFSGDYEAAIIYSILHEEPASSASIRPEAPAFLEQVVKKALAKNPNLRYQSTPELLADLRQATPVPIVLPKAEKSIVVLPFKNISPDPENEYFSDGLTEEIIADLSKVQALRVISRTSTMKLKGTDKDLKTIGRELQVQYVLEGSVRKAGNNLRITAQLIDAAADAHLWADKYGGTVDDVFDIQEKVSRAIVEALKVKLSPEENQKIADRPLPNVQAYDLYIRARHEILQFSAESLARALDFVQKGLDIAGDNVLLLAAKGYAHWQFFNCGIKADESVLQEAEKCAQRLFELQPESVYGYRLLGLIQVSRGNVHEAVRHLKRALSLDPNDPDALMWLNLVYATAGKIELARPLIQRLLEIDPLTPSNYMFASAAPFYNGEFSAALAPMRRAYELEPENLVHRFFYFLFLAAYKNFDEAFALADLLVKDTPEAFFTRLALFLQYALRGEKEKALALTNDEFNAAARVDWQYSSLMAGGYALLQEKDQALAWLENAINRGFINYPFIARHDPFLENLRGDERFEKLMVKTKEAWEHFEA